MAKMTGTCHKARYKFKIMRKHVKDLTYLDSKLPKKVSSISKHAKQRMREKNFKVTKEELTSLLICRNLLDIQVGFDGEITFVFRGNLGREYDTSFVINRKGKVISVWANHKADNHKTLDESIYRKDVDITTIL